jgi:hypothetical protein
MKEVVPNLNKEDKELMEDILVSGKVLYKYAVRIQTVLLKDRGKRTNDTADFLNINPAAVSLHVRRYNDGGT